MYIYQVLKSKDNLSDVESKTITITIKRPNQQMAVTYIGDRHAMPVKINC